MTTNDSRAGYRLTVHDLAPMRRMLGSHSLVVRVGSDGSLMPFELLPELFLGRSIRRLLADDIRAAFEELCHQVVATKVGRCFNVGIDKLEDQIMVAPVFDKAEGEVQYLICWARQVEQDSTKHEAAAGRSWEDLHLDHVELRFRASGPNTVDISPWWSSPSGMVELWANIDTVTSLAFAAEVMAALVVGAARSVAASPDVSVRISLPSSEAMAGLVPTFAGIIRTTGADPERITLTVPIEIAADKNLTPLILHLRLLGLRIDVTGVEALAESLGTVSANTALRSLPAAQVRTAGGEWSDSIEAALSLVEAA